MDSTLLANMIEPTKVALFVPPELTQWKRDFFMKIAIPLRRAGGKIIDRKYDELIWLSEDIIPIIGCSTPLRQHVERWIATNRTFIFWDRGYLRRPDYYRWTVNGFQMQSISNVPDDRWRALGMEGEIKPWHQGDHIIVADTGEEYWDFFSDRNWVDRTVATLRQHTDRKIRVRRKHGNAMSLWQDLKDAHALVSHGSIAAVESVLWGCPVFVDKVSAARHVGLTDFSKIETPVYPNRNQWLRSLAYSQFSDLELFDLSFLRFLRGPETCQSVQAS
jgi:hypothetical protein